MPDPITPTTPTDGAETPATPVTPVVETPKAETPVTPETKPEGQEAATSLMDEAAAEEKQTQEVENKRLLETPDDKLSDDDKIKKTEVVKAKEVADKAARKNIIPEKYEFTVPEGMALDVEYADKASVILKKHGITQSAASELATLAAEQIKKIVEGKEKSDAENFSKFVNGLREETIKELGANYKQELAAAAKARDRLMPKELVQKLNDSGLANDKDVVKFLISLGKSISEGKFIEGRSSAADENSESAALAKLYPTTPPK